MTMTHNELLQAIKARKATENAWNEGILTADRYVQTLQDCIGSDLCYRYTSQKNVGFSDVLKRASQTLTYNNPEMALEDNYGTTNYKWTDSEGDELELPKNTLMVFRHVLTTPRKDRDGDILRTQGAKPDPKMLLLWQHIHTLPIGKMLVVAEHNSKKLSVVSAIVDINSLAHDAAVMVENKMGRFSHGFKALEFSKVKEETGKPTSGGFDVKVFEIMEESLVSVPSNVDSDTEEILLSLVEGGKLTSPIMKSYGKGIRQDRPKEFNIPFKLDVNVNVNGKKVAGKEEVAEDDEEQDKSGKGKHDCGCGGKKPEGCGCGGAGTSKEADGDSAGQADAAHDEEVGTKGHVGDASENDTVCPQCGKAMLDSTGTCQECGYILESGKKSTKVGRILSKSNYNKLAEVRDDILEIHEMHTSTRSGKVMTRSCADKLTDVIMSAGYEGQTEVEDITAKDAMAAFLALADKSDRRKMKSAIDAIEFVEKRVKRTKGMKKHLIRK